MLFIVPSRGRPANVEALIGAWDQTRVTARLFIAVDEDDEQLPEYAKILRYAPPWVGWRRTRPAGMVGALNLHALALSRHPHMQTAIEDIIGFMGDDHRPRTYGWDTMIEGEMRRTEGAVVYCNDLLQGVNLPTQVALPTAWIRLLGYMAPETLQHLYVDNYWKTLGEKLGRLSYLPDVIIEHMHPVAGKAEWDDGYKRVNAGSVYQHDGAAFTELCNAGVIDRDARKIWNLLHTEGKVS